jgi:hypothetical protein
VLYCLDWFLLNEAMFIGHYSVAFAAKTERNKIPLRVLFVAVQFLDYIWATLVLLGIEKLRVIKGFTAGSMLDSYYHPYSHSLIAAVLWSCVAAIGYTPLCSRLGYSYRKSAALVVAMAVFSHWILDLVAHPRDLPIYDNTWKVGFGLWNCRGLEIRTGNRSARRWNYLLPDTQCHVGSSQKSRHRFWRRFNYYPNRRHVRALHAVI